MVADKDDLDLLICRSVEVPDPLTAVEAWTVAMGNVKGVAAVYFRLRDWLITRLGGKPFIPANVDAPSPEHWGAQGSGLVVTFGDERTLRVSSRDALREGVMVLTMSPSKRRAVITISVRAYSARGRWVVRFLGPLFAWVVAHKLAKLPERLHKT